MTLDKS